MRHQPGSLVEREDRGQVSVLTFNRPERHNAWSPEMATDLGKHLDDLADSDDVRCCVLTGAGSEAFSSGADLGDARTHTATAGDYLRELHPSGHRTFRRLIDFPKPIIAAVNGYAIGAGFLIATCCDVITASENAQFALPQVRLGILPAYGGTPRLAQWIGRGRALEIALTGRRVSAAEAQAIGLALSTHPSAQLLPATMEIAETLSQLPPLSVKLVKQSLNMATGDSSTYPGGMADLLASFALQKTDDAAEAHRAFHERRPGKYTGN